MSFNSFKNPLQNFFFCKILALIIHLVIIHAQFINIDAVPALCMWKACFLG